MVVLVWPPSQQAVGQLPLVEREMRPLCETEEIGVIPWSPLARGLIAGSRKALREKSGSTRQETDQLTDYLYDHDSDWEVVEAVAAVAKERELPPAQIGLSVLIAAALPLE